MKYNNRIKLCLSFFLAFVINSIAYAQNTQIYRAVVVDEANEPIIGATVKVLDTSIGIITDLNGNFSISVPEGKTVEISFVGYATQRISELKQTRIVLKEDATQLDEVVVVGYGTQKKAHLTGAISTVPIDEIQDLSSGSLATTLSGIVNGISVKDGQARPGENARITIRQNDVFGEYGARATHPLYVIDGYIYPSDVKVGNNEPNLGADAFNNLDVSMIESISVLKDASAAVYGSRAANGVILVTTKKGKIGSPKISYSGQIGFTDEVSRPKMLNAYEYGKLWNAVRTADPSDTSLNTLSDLFQADELQAMKGLNYDLLDKYWKVAMTQKHSLNLSGATERANYFADISYFTQDGNLGKLDYERWNYRAGVDLKISKWVKANLQISGDYGEKNKPFIKIGTENEEKDYNMLLNRPRYIPENVGDYPIATIGPTNDDNMNALQNYSFAVLQDLGNYSQDMTQNTTINTGLEYDFGWSKYLKGLKLKFTYSKSISTAKNNQFASSYEIYKMEQRSGSGSHLYTGLNDEMMVDENFKLSTGSVITNGNFLSRWMNRADNYQMNFMAIYNRSFGLHDVNGLFSIERSEFESEYVEAKRNDPYEFTNGQSNGTTGSSDNKFTRAESGSLSYVGRANYAYDDKYLLELLVRIDASTKFAPENYWGTFPSLSAGWIITQEEWFKKNVKWIDYLKLRGSFGLVGRDNVTAWAWMQTYALNQDKGPVFGTSSTNNSGSHITIDNQRQAVNRDAHWDKNYKGNLGLDFNVLNNRLSINLDTYYEWNREIFMKRNAEIPGTVGSQAAAENYGKINSWGTELSVSWRDKIGKDFKYRIQVNTGYSDNKVILMAWDSSMKLKSVYPNQRTDTGEWGLQCIGMFRNYQDINEYFDKYMKKDDGTFGTYLGLAKDKVHPGMLIYKDIRGEVKTDGTYDPNPDHIISNEHDLVKMSHRDNPYGLTTNLSAEWKGISLTAQISADWGGYSFLPGSAIKINALSGGESVRDKKYNDLQYTSMPSFWKDMYVYENIYDAAGNLVVAENHSAKYPNLRFSENSESSTFWRVSGTRIKLNRITIAYAIPKKYTNRIGLENCRFNVTGQNLLSLYNPYPDNFIDPMTKYGNYPTLRKFTVGVNVTF